MILTATFKLRANDHDARRLRVAVSRWHDGMRTTLARARREERALLRCIVPWTSKDGSRSRLVVDAARLHALVPGWVPNPLPGLHSSARMSMVVDAQGILASYLGLRAAWQNGDRKEPAPEFPTVKPGSERAALARWDAALAAAPLDDLAAEDAWRAEVTRAAKGGVLPHYFGAATSGMASQAHCGILRRADGQYFALLTLFPQGDGLGEPVTRARNRRERGSLHNVADTAARAEASHLRACRKAEQAGLPEPERLEWRQSTFEPTERARASIVCPLEMEHGHQRLFFGRGTPRSAELFARGGDFFLHVAFELADHPPRELSGSVLACVRGIGTLVSWSLVTAAGRVERTGTLDGKDLARLIGRIHALRARRQQEGKVLRGDRRAARVVEHHMDSAGHQLVDLACQASAEIVLLEDREPRAGTFLRWKHFHLLAEDLAQFCAEAGLPPPRVRKLYGKWSTCLACGWAHGDPVRMDPLTLSKEQCGGCGAPQGPHHLATLLGMDTLRLRREGDQRVSLQEFVKEVRSR